MRAVPLCEALDPRHVGHGDVLGEHVDHRVRAPGVDQALEGAQVTIELGIRMTSRLLDDDDRISV